MFCIANRGLVEKNKRLNKEDDVCSCMELEYEVDRLREGVKVDVYHNFHTGSWSIRSREPENYGRVVAHEDAVCVKDAEFVVSQSQRQKVLETGTKNVHAVVRGKITKSEVSHEVNVTYNPKKYKNFVDCDTEECLKSAEKVHLTENGVFAENVTCKNQ